jgi:heme oxygenase
MPKHKYNGTRDFRTQKPELSRTEGGWRWIKVCEELIGGRWEGFVAMLEPVYQTEEEALKHKPKW